MNKFGTRSTYRQGRRLPVRQFEKVVDVCLVNDEVFLARMRAEYLRGLVHHHVFVEANVTHSGSPRCFSILDEWPGNLAENISVVHLDVPSSVLSLGDRWAIEEYSRQWAVQYASHLFPRSALLVSDIDEFPSRGQVAGICEALRGSPIVTLPMVVSDRKANWLSRQGLPFWTKAKAFRSDYFDSGFRFRRAPTVSGAPGQHFRYLDFTADLVSRKHAHFAHRELDTATWNTEAMRFIDRYELHTVPDFERKGSGLLTRADGESLTDPAIFLASVSPNLLEGNRPLEPFSDRFVASYLANKVHRRDRDPVDILPSAGVKRFVTLIRAIGAKAFALFGCEVALRVLKRLGNRPIVRPGRTPLDILRGVNHYGEWDELKIIDWDKRGRENF